MADIKSILLPNGTEYNIRDDSKVAKSGDTMTGAITLKGTNLILSPMSSEYNVDGGLIWNYGNSNEKAEIFFDSVYSSAAAPYYRLNNSSGSELHFGNLILERTVTKTYTFPAGGAVYIYKFGRVAVFKINGVGIGVPSTGYANVMTLDAEDRPIDTFYSEWTNFRSNSPEYFMINPSGVVQLVGPKNTETTWWQNITYILAE